MCGRFQNASLKVFCYLVRCETILWSFSFNSFKPIHFHCPISIAKQSLFNEFQTLTFSAIEFVLAQYLYVCQAR